MSTLKTDTITNVAGTGGPTLTNGATFGSAAFAAPSGSAPMYACRAWVNFNGTGTVAISASGNVSSITDNGTGVYTVNFTTAMPDGNYALQGSNIGSTSVYPAIVGSSTVTNTASAARFKTINYGSTQVDFDAVSISVFR